MKRIVRFGNEPTIHGSIAKSGKRKVHFNE